MDGNSEPAEAYTPPVMFAAIDPGSPDGKAGYSLYTSDALGPLVKTPGYHSSGSAIDMSWDTNNSEVIKTLSASLNKLYSFHAGDHQIHVHSNDTHYSAGTTDPTPSFTKVAPPVSLSWIIEYWLDDGEVVVAETCSISCADEHESWLLDQGYATRIMEHDTPVAACVYCAGI